MLFVAVYLHYAGLDHLNEYHDGNGVLSSVMVRGIKASFGDDKQYNQNVPFQKYARDFDGGILGNQG